MERKRNQTTHLCFTVSFIFMFSICTLLSNTSTSGSSTLTCLDTNGCPMFAKANTDFQEPEERIGQSTTHEGTTEVSVGWARRLLGGPGSSPPRCASKCGKCTPCTPVHVPVPPGTPVTAEYYPEAWRCKCGNKLYMP